MCVTTEINGQLFTAGHGLVVKQFRRTSECGGIEELPLIDENLSYDFNYQQSTYLPKIVKVFPVVLAVSDVNMCANNFSMLFLSG